jgi:uncharacterized UBP type Zn finger protein
MPGRNRSRADHDSRRCVHVRTAGPVDLSSTVCEQCTHLGQDWVELWLCLSCGWVACSDDSPGRHARAHYEETDHPIAAALRQQGSHPRWCHVHRRTV